MPRKWILALLALLVVTPALAQVMQVRRPVIAVPVTPQAMESNDDIAQKVMTIEEAKAQIAKLNREKREANAKLAEALATIDQMTKKGGSLVRAYCSDRSVSTNTAGGSEDCGRYICGESEGLCKKQCSASTDCTTGFSCDGGQCLTLGEVQARG